MRLQIYKVFYISVEWETWHHNLSHSLVTKVKNRRCQNNVSIFVQSHSLVDLKEVRDLKDTFFNFMGILGKFVKKWLHITDLIQ